jgi:hypothetical protein
VLFQSKTHPTKLQSLKTNKQKLFAVASRQDVSWDGGGVSAEDSTTKAQNQSIPNFVWGYNTL